MAASLIFGDGQGIYCVILLMRSDEFDENDARATQVAEDAADFAENSPDPALEELYTDVMVDNSTALAYRYERGS